VADSAYVTKPGTAFEEQTPNSAWKQFGPVWNSRRCWMRLPVEAERGAWWVAYAARVLLSERKILQLASRFGRWHRDRERNSIA
jgi:hypothetical protein